MEKEMFMLLILILTIGLLLFYINKEQKEIKNGDSVKENSIEAKNEITPMTLRNGFGVTKDKNPTFAEQWVNLMNYNGESQKEGSYD